MAQYQTFPDSPGDSLTLDKLKALRLPDLNGLSFLDVGCNEGFFCGFAKFRGASRSVGLDHAAGFIERARNRFPDCEFLNQGWESLPEGPFDVVLLASALHYADDQEVLIARLAELLSRDGVLVLEIGIASSPDSKWVEVERGIDRRSFPTMKKLQEILSPYAWKWMGPSISQAGDPVARHVVHVSRPRPVVYALLQPPAYGKTTLAKSLFIPAGVPIVSGDEVILELAKGERSASPGLEALVKEEYSPYHLDAVLQRIFDACLGDELVELWTQGLAGQSFALDGFVPVEHHETVLAALRKLGYLPVQLRWERPGLSLLPAAELDRQGEEFYLSLMSGETEDGKTFEPGGFVDEVSMTDGNLEFRGWAVDKEGRLPQGFIVSCGGESVRVEEFSRVLRPDVQKHIGAAHALLGFRFVVPGDLLPASKQELAAITVKAMRDGEPISAFFLRSTSHRE